MASRGGRNSLDSAISDLRGALLVLGGAFQTIGNRWLTYREMGASIGRLLFHEMGYTHVEFLPMMEHPFDGSYGDIRRLVILRQRLAGSGTPSDFMYLIDYLHQQGIGVIFGLGSGRTFQKTKLRPGVTSMGLIFTNTRIRDRRSNRTGIRLFLITDATKCRSFLISNALFWLDKYHVDGLRVDGVAS